MTQTEHDPVAADTSAPPVEASTDHRGPAFDHHSRHLPGRLKAEPTPGDDADRRSAVPRSLTRPYSASQCPNRGRPPLTSVAAPPQRRISKRSGDVMADQPLVQSLGMHDYLLQVREGEDLVRVRVHATPAVVARIADSDSDESWVIEATAAYLIARQRADDLPAMLDLDDVAAAYPGYVEDLRAQLVKR